MAGRQSRSPQRDCCPSRARQRQPAAAVRGATYPRTGPIGARGTCPAAETCSAGFTDSRDLPLVVGELRPGHRLLLTLLWWWQQRRRQPQGKVDSIPEKPLEVRERDAFKQLLAAARSNDPVATRQALVVWGRSRWPERCSNLEQLALLLDEPLQIFIENLSRELYSKTAGAWQGEDLMRELQRWRGQK